MFVLCGWVCANAQAAHVEPAVLARAQRDGSAEVLLVLPDQARPALAFIAPGADYRARRRALVDALRSRAQTQQAALIDWLRSRDIAFRAYWISNLVWARLSAAQIAALSERGDLARIAADTRLPVHLPTPGVSTASMVDDDPIAWGVEKIGAPLAWAAGFAGAGIVIGGEDTGYQWNHPALQPHYRGWNGVSAEHAYHWHDAIHDAAPGNVCGSDSPFPCDDYGHGTHTAGTFAGGDGGSHQIGVAPAAKWIGCRNMADGIGTPARYIECMQWMLAPTDLSDADPEPDLAPDVISNSWTCTVDEGCTAGNELEGAVDTLVAAGIFYVAAAANDGPACGTINAPPAIYDASFVIGATDSNDAMASFSSRGPVSGTTRLRPDLSAPGVDVPSAWNDGGYRYDSGTSMATPHVAGAAALVMSANPALKGHPDQVAQILRAASVTAGVSDPYNSGCGGLDMTTWPNYQAGYGRLDAWTSVRAALAAVDVIFRNGFDD